jgi:uncharacterized protein YndB with AHSA1/START domain
MTARPHQLSLELRRLLTGDPIAVFAAFADAQTLSRWWGPRGFTIPALHFAPRPGDDYRIAMQPPEGAAFFLSGRFQEVDPPSRLAFTFAWEDPDPDDVETRVELTFRAVGAGTEVALVQGPFRTEARRALHRDGWSDSLDKLERVLAATA